MEKLREKNILNSENTHQKNSKLKIIIEISVSGTTPAAEWNSATVIQIYIKGDRKDPNNYKLIN
jgi:hypothetical protein